MYRSLTESVAGKKHSKIQFDPEENQWKLQVMNNPNISATSFASISTKAIGGKIKICLTFQKIFLASISTKAISGKK